MVDIAHDHSSEDQHHERDAYGAVAGLSPPSTRAAASTRRGFLAMVGGVAATVAVGGAVAGDVYAVRRGVFASGSGPAYAPWNQWDRGAAPLRLVRAGILAANAHNAQAWRFGVSARRIQVYHDTGRGLGAVDPYRREVHLSAGCAIENIALAAAAAGLAPTVTLAPSGHPELLATVDLTPGTSAISELYQAIPHRHTDRGAYQSGRTLAASIPRGMDDLAAQPDVRVHWLLTAAQRAAFTAVTLAATEAFIADAQQAADDYAWYRGTWQQVQASRDGVTIDASGLPALMRSVGKLIPASRTSNDTYWLSGTRDRQLPTASGFGILLVRDAGDIAQRLGAGRLYQRLHLWATTRGLAMQPLNQSVERAERERSTTGPGGISASLATLVGDPTWQPVMPFRLGYPTSPAPASPRRAIGDVLVTTP